jgi:hypothetical protein
MGGTGSRYGERLRWMRGTIENKKETHSFGRSEAYAEELEFLLETSNGAEMGSDLLLRVSVAYDGSFRNSAGNSIDAGPTSRPLLHEYAMSEPPGVVAWALCGMERRSVEE